MAKKIVSFKMVSDFSKMIKHVDNKPLQYIFIADFILIAYFVVGFVGSALLKDNYVSKAFFEYFGKILLFHIPVILIMEFVKAFLNNYTISKKVK